MEELIKEMREKYRTARQLMGESVEEKEYYNSIIEAQKILTEMRQTLADVLKNPDLEDSLYKKLWGMRIVTIYDLGLIAFALGDIKEALSCLDEVLVMIPDKMSRPSPNFVLLSIETRNVLGAEYIDINPKVAARMVDEADKIYYNYRKVFPKKDPCSHEDHFAERMKFTGADQLVEAHSLTKFYLRQYSRPVSYFYKSLNDCYDTLQIMATTKITDLSARAEIAIILGEYFINEREFHYGRYLLSLAAYIIDKYEENTKELQTKMEALEKEKKGIKNEKKEGEINEKKEEEINGKKDEQINEKKEEQVNGKKEEEINEKKEEQIIEKKDEQINGKKEEQINEKKEEQINGKKEEQINEKKEEQINDKKEEQINEKKEEQINGKKEEQINEKKEEQINEKKEKPIIEKKKKEGTETPVEIRKRMQDQVISVIVEERKGKAEGPSKENEILVKVEEEREVADDEILVEVEERKGEAAPSVKVGGGAQGAGPASQKKPERRTSEEMKMRETLGTWIEYEEPTVEEEIKGWRAFLARAWVKYGLHLMKFASQAIDEPKIEVTKDLPRFPKIEDLDLSNYENLVTDEYPKTADEAGTLFLFTQYKIVEAKEYYTLFLYPHEHVALTQEHSLLIRYMMKYETNEKVLRKYLKARIKMLEPLSLQLNYKYYLPACRLLWFELGKCYHELLLLKYDNMNAKGGHEMRKAVERINHYCSTGMVHLHNYIDSFRNKKFKLPDPVPSEAVAKLAFAHFYLGRLYHAYITFDQEEANEFTLIAFSCFRYVLKHCEKDEAMMEALKYQYEMLNAVRVGCYKNRLLLVRHYPEV